MLIHERMLFHRLFPQIDEAEEELMKDKGRANGIAELRVEVQRVAEMCGLLRAIKSCEAYAESLIPEEEREAARLKAEKEESAAADLLLAFG